MSAETNATEIRVIGMSRSGNHAIVDWILAQADGRTCLLNCAEPTHNPFEWARPLGPHEPGHRTNYPFDIEAERAGRLSRKDVLVHTYEDVFLGSFARPEHEQRRERFVGRSRRRFDVLIVRDPYNLFASRRAARAGVLGPELAVRVWCQHAREFLGLRRYLREPRVCVSYNAWAVSSRYRRSVAEALGLDFDDRAAPRVPSCAGGSSFDGTDLDGAADRMAVLDRWRRYEDDAAYARLFRRDVHDLSRRIFGELPPSRALAPAA